MNTIDGNGTSTNESIELEGEICKRIYGIIVSTSAYEKELGDRARQYEVSIKQNHIPDGRQQFILVRDVRKRLDFLALQFSTALDSLEELDIGEDWGKALKMKKRSVKNIQKWLDETDSFILAIDRTKILANTTT